MKPPASGKGYGTFDELADKVDATWNVDRTIMTILFPDIYQWLDLNLEGGLTLIATVHLTDVEGASGTMESQH